jgi:hydrogenase maturation protease
MTRVVVAGLGNPWRGDDGAGLAVVERLRGVLPEEIELVTIVDDPTRLLDAFSADKVVLADAVAAPEPRPGTVHRIDAAHELLPPSFGSSTHHFGLADTVELARSLGRLPRSLVVYGIEGATFDAGDRLDPRVEEATAAVAARIAAELEEDGDA